MSLMDFIDNMRYGGWRDFLEEGKELLVEGKNTFKDLKDEGREIFTDGFKEMVVKDNNSYKTSFEKKDQALNIISQSQNKYEKAYSTFKEKALALEHDIESHYSNITSIIQTSIANWAEQAKDWDDLCLERYAAEKMLDITTLSLTPTTGVRRIQKISGKNVLNTKPEYKAQEKANIFLRMILSDSPFLKESLKQIERVKAADEFLLAAQDFESRVEIEILGLKKYKNDIKCVTLRIKEVKTLLHFFENELANILDNMNDACKSGQLSKIYYKKAQMTGLIVSSMIALIEDSFVSKDGNIVERNESLYLDIMQIKNLISNV